MYRLAMHAKQTLRTQIGHKLRDLPSQERFSYSRDICEQLLTLTKVSEARVVMGYLPMKHEVNIRPFLDACITQGKIVLLPKVVSSTAMEAVHTFALHDLEKGSQ